jgi:A/G-specific adenine glycosylase
MQKDLNFSKILINWYLKHKRDLPWRHTTNPYFIWLSEIMLQQTQVAQGLPYYLKFTKAYPTVFHLANASQEEVLKNWQGLGYYTRARNLHETANYIANECYGKFPNNYKGLLKLKGVGDYTASAIASICYDEPVAVVDGNVYRVLSRYFGVQTPINSTEGIKGFKALAEILLDKKQSALFNQAIMEFGARHCKPKNPFCETCPFNDSCKALQNKNIGELPVKLKKTKVKKRFLNYIVYISNSDRTQLRQRVGKGIWQGLYEFPCIETKKEITAKEFYSLFEASNVSDGINENYTITLFNESSIVHKLSHQHLYTKFWIVRVKDLQTSISTQELKDYPVPVLIARFLEDFSF